MEALPESSDETRYEAGCFSWVRYIMLGPLTFRFPAGNYNTGVTFANLGPFKVVSELVRFQRLWIFSIDVKDGKLC